MDLTKIHFLKFFFSSCFFNFFLVSLRFACLELFFDFSSLVLASPL